MFTANLTSSIEEYLQAIVNPNNPSALALSLLTEEIEVADRYSEYQFRPCYVVRPYAGEEFYLAAKSNSSISVRHMGVPGGQRMNGNRLKKHQFQLTSASADMNDASCNRDFVVSAIGYGLKTHQLCFRNAQWGDIFEYYDSGVAYEEKNNVWTARSMLLINLG
jgi:hypothetical protein